MTADAVTGPDRAGSRASYGPPNHHRSRDDYGTPPWLYSRLDEEFHFTLDPCPFPRPPGYDGLTVPWKGRVFVNPPYGEETARWVEHGVAQIDTGNAEVVVFLVFARTDTKWFHRLVLPRAEVRFIRGRVSFVGGEASAPYPSMVCIFRATAEKIRFAGIENEEP